LYLVGLIGVRHSPVSVGHDVFAYFQVLGPSCHWTWKQNIPNWQYLNILRINESCYCLPPPAGGSVDLLEISAIVALPVTSAATVAVPAAGPKIYQFALFLYVSFISYLTKKKSD
jgi:hypothetical protein